MGSPVDIICFAIAINFNLYLQFIHGLHYSVESLPVRSGDRRSGKGISQQFHYWPLELDQRMTGERQEREQAPVQLETRITRCKLASSYLNTWYLHREPELRSPYGS
jgi:hypothetical protein